MRSALVGLLLLQAFPTPQVAYPPGQPGLQIPGGMVEPPDLFPTGASHVWKMEEASGNRLDSIGTNPMVPTGSGGSGISQVAGIDGFGVASDGTSYLLPSAISATNGMTVAVWGQGQGTGTYLIGTQGEVSIVSNSTSVIFTVFDQFSGEGDSGTINTTGFSSGYGLHILRLNNLTTVLRGRVYGYPAGNGSDVTGTILSGSGWANGLLSITPQPFHTQFGTASAGKVDELAVWPRELTDAECDLLQTWFYRP